MSSLTYINLRACSLRRIHNIWKLGAACTLTVMKASILMKLLTQRYPLMTSRTAGKAYGSPCPLCNTQVETMNHFILRCPELEGDRGPYIQQLSNTLHSHGVRGPRSEDDMVRLILDPSNHTDNEETQLQLMYIARNLCFKLHYRRSLSLGNGSVYKLMGKMAK